MNVLSLRVRHSGFGKMKPTGHKMNPNYQHCDKMRPAGFNFGLRVSLIVKKLCDYGALHGSVSVNHGTDLLLNSIVK